MHRVEDAPRRDAVTDALQPPTRARPGRIGCSGGAGRGDDGVARHPLLESGRTGHDARARHGSKSRHLAEHANTEGGVSNPERSSYQLQSSVSQPLPGGLRGRVRVDYFSDITAQQLYNNNLYQQTFSTRSFGGGLTGSWKGLSVSGQYQRTESFFDQSNSNVSGQAPGITTSPAPDVNESSSVRTKTVSLSRPEKVEPYTPERGVPPTTPGYTTWARDRGRGWA